jgi:hypothetical protein
MGQRWEKNRRKNNAEECQCEGDAGEGRTVSRARRGRRMTETEGHLLLVLCSRRPRLRKRSLDGRNWTSRRVLPVEIDDEQAWKEYV